MWWRDCRSMVVQRWLWGGRWRVPFCAEDMIDEVASCPSQDGGRRWSLPNGGGHPRCHPQDEGDGSSSDTGANVHLRWVPALLCPTGGTVASEARRAACTRSTKLEERKMGHENRRHHLLGGFVKNIVHMVVVNPPHVQVKANQGCIGPR